ncbi:TAP42-like protein [Echria macrotheca]|uniref:TAP42-like protein n=1 Tax=Echria macrotheca TaxID=438768 RepID=A0AAJ0BK05_9PEZI|nr:TAP42-like protein [Echria macrotheca]
MADQTPAPSLSGDLQPDSLKDQFLQAEKARIEIQTPRLPPWTPEEVSRVVSMYRMCLAMGDNLSLFSPNETLDDISTSDLPYLQTKYHIGKLLSGMPFQPGETTSRIAVIRDAKESFVGFLEQLDSYGLLAPAHKKLLERYGEDPDNFSMVASKDPASRRDVKIASFKTEKELRAKMEFLRNRPGYGDPESGEGGDEEIVRETQLATIAFQTHLAFQELESLNEELAMLSHAEATQRQAGPANGAAAGVRGGDPSRERPPEDPSGYSDRLDLPLRQMGRGIGAGGPLLSKQGKPLQPFTLVGSRQELAKGVFRPGHNLPTMSIDEYLEEERRRGGIIEGGGEASGQRPEPDEDNIEKADAETMKAREWDEFTEANARGSGNTLNRG